MGHLIVPYSELLLFTEKKMKKHSGQWRNCYAPHVKVCELIFCQNGMAKNRLEYDL